MIEQKFAPKMLGLSFLAAMALLACKKDESASTRATAGAETPATPANIAGNYNVTGTNPDGQGSYTASLVVTPRNDVYQFSWVSGATQYEGVGVVNGNTVAVSYTAGADGKGCGVVLYAIASDASLDGKVGYWGVNSSEVEKATRRSGSDLAGAYDIKGSNASGTEYKGTLAIAPKNAGYTFKWHAGNTFDGFGVKQGDKAIVGFGGKQCAFVVYEKKPDGTLDGKWGGQGNKILGTETAKKK